MAGLEWDAATYDRISDMQLETGRDFLAHVELRGDEVAIDAGCGTGRITELLIDRLPRGRVIGVDGSAAMIEQARERLGPEIELIVSDLLELDPPEPVDLVFSTATFHWLADHDRLYAAVYGWLKPGGMLAAQLGGKGNVQEMIEPVIRIAAEQPFAEHLRGVEDPWNFPPPEQTAGQLERAGFVDVRIETEERTFEFDEPRTFQRTVGLVVHLDRLPEELREPFLDTVLAELRDPSTAHFVRTNLFARHP